MYWKLPWAIPQKIDKQSFKSYVFKTYVFSSWATASFSLQEMLWRVLIGLCAMVMPCACNICWLFLRCFYCQCYPFCSFCWLCLVSWEVSPFFTKLHGYPFFWNMWYRQFVSFFWYSGLLQCVCTYLNNYKHMTSPHGI